MDGTTFSVKPGASRHIFFYLPSFAGGGAERVMIRLAAHLAHLGHDVSFVVNRDTGPLRPLLPANVPLHVLETPRAHVALPRLVKLLRREHPRWLVSAMTRTNLVALAAARLSRSGTGVLACERNHFEGFWAGQDRTDRIIARFGVRLLYPSAAAVIGNAPGVTEAIGRAAGLPGGAAVTICNPAPDTAEIHAARQAPCPDPWLSSDRDRPALLAMARLAPQKDYPTMLEALALSGSGARLLVLGEGPERSALETRSRALGIEGRVKFLGWRDNRFDYLVRADLFVLSSITEGFPNALVEAMAAGVPAVSTDCAGGGATEILSPELAGSIVPVGDAAALAAAIDRALQERPGAEQIAEIAARYDIDSISNAFLERMPA